MSWNVDAPEFVPGRRFLPQSWTPSAPESSKEVPLNYRTNVTSGEPSSSTSTDSLRYSDVTAFRSEAPDFTDVRSGAGGRFRCRKDFLGVFLLDFVSLPSQPAVEFIYAHITEYLKL